MTQLLLIRHAENDWVRTGRLAGWTPGVHLNENGRKQAEALGKRLAGARLTALYSSPLERAMETAQAIASHYPGLTIQPEEGIGEVHFGEWTGRRLMQLARTRLWQIVQHQPAGARFPQGESFFECQFRLVQAVERIAATHPGGRVALVSHSDVIKLVIAHYAGIHLDLFQRLTIAPASISAIELHRGGPRILRLNDTAHYDPSDNGRG